MSYKNVEDRRKYGREHYALHREVRLKAIKEYIQSHREQINLCRRKNYDPKKESVYRHRYWLKNKEKLTKRTRIWKVLHPGKVQQWEKKSREELADKYVRKRLKRIGINNDFITPELIQMKREQVLLFRNLKKLKEVYNESNYSNTEGIESKVATSYQAQNNSG